MKFLSRLILLSICFELVLSPIKPELAMFTILKANASTDCPQGMTWNDAANMCKVNATTAQTQRDLEACAKLSGEAQQKCYQDNADKGANAEGTSRLSSGDIQAMYKGNSAMLNVAKTAAYSLPLMLFGYMLLSHKKGEKRCLPPSTIAMITAGVAMMGGEVYGFIKHKSNLNKLDKARQSLFTPKSTDNLDQKKVDATQMQSEAFQLLADEQASVEALAKAKKIFYGVSMSAYAAAAGIATYELIAIKMAKKKLALAMARAAANNGNLNTSAAYLSLQQAYARYNIKDGMYKRALAKVGTSSLDETTSMLNSKQKQVEKLKNDFKDNKNNLQNARATRDNIEDVTSNSWEEADKNVTQQRKNKNDAKKDLQDAKKEANELQSNLKQLQSISTGYFPDVETASKNLEKLFVKYECWQDAPKKEESQPIKISTEKTKPPKENTAEVKQENQVEGIKPNEDFNLEFSNPNNPPPVVPPQSNNLNDSNVHDLKNLSLIATQINHIKNAQSIEELSILTDQLEQIKSGAIQSEYVDYKPTSQFKSDSDKLFLQINSELTALKVYNEYFQQPEVSDEKIIEKVFTIVQNNIGFPKAYAQGAALTSILGLIPVLLGASSLFKKKEKSGAGYSMPGADEKAAAEAAKPKTFDEIDTNPTVQKTRDGFGAFMRTPTFRIAFGGVLGGLTYFMVKEMADQQKIAGARKETLLKLKGDFENTQGMKICSPQERNDQNQPGCYCYTAEGTRNMSRSASAICQNMWNSVNLNGSSYLSSSDLNGKVCITQSNAIDEKCSCRTSNTCLKASGFNISGISLGTLSALGSGLAPIATASSGNGAELNTDAIVNGAMKLRDATDKVLAGNDLKNENAIVKAAEKSLGNFVQANGGTLGSPSASRSTPSSLANFDAKAALEEIKKEVEASPDIKGVANSGVGFDSGSSTEPALEFGLTEEEAAIQEEQVAEVLKQDMDLGNNDISGSSTNLFEVLSHRYKRSGMRRLFDTEGKTEAEKPAETDINK